ncbi:hypothetical protein HFD88_007984 [Aspergillus terreus]|nr:hypothetical protein HFD88_007984 [Aspergillus terreus]
MDGNRPALNEPICVASTLPEDSLSSKNEISPENDSGSQVPDNHKPNYYKGAEWTPDGTTLVTDASDHHIRTYVLPPDLLEERSSPLQLSPYSVLPSGEPTYATAIYPFYSLQDPSTTLFLSSVRDHPIRLASALAPVTLASYSLVNPMTEAFITPHSIVYPSTLGGTHFLTGSDSLICLFDVSRPGGEGPVSWMPTIPSKRKQIVGTFSRQIGLYGSNGSGESLGTFSIVKTEANRHIGGRGVTQLLWSPCGRYLYIAERQSDGVLIYDIRVTGQLLGWLKGRKALTNQRMKIDVVPAGESHEIWAGGTDGVMRMWQDPTRTVGEQMPAGEWKVHDDAVSSTVLHPSGTVAATTSGQRHYRDDDTPTVEKALTGFDNTLKVWSMPFLNAAPED